MVKKREEKAISSLTGGVLVALHLTCVVLAFLSLFAWVFFEKVIADSWKFWEYAFRALRVGAARLGSVPLGVIVLAACIAASASHLEAEELSDLLDLSYPGLEKVKEAVEKGDERLAREELLEYYRHRKIKNTKWYLSDKGRDFNKMDADELVEFLKTADRKYMHRMVQSLSQTIQWMNEDNYRSGSNWALGQHDIVKPFIVGAYLPELKASREWREISLQRVYEELSEQFYPDGGHIEISSYHYGTTIYVLEVMLQARYSDIALPEDFEARVLRVLEWIMYTMRPDGSSVGIGDGGIRDDLRQRYFRDYGQILWPQRKDFAFLASAEEKVGAPPEKTSLLFPDSGIFVMRTDWTPEALYLLMKASPAGNKKLTRGALAGGRSSHSHYDQLSILLSAYGENFLMDWPPIDYSATLPDGKTRVKNECKRTKYHNTIALDGHDQRSILDAKVEDWATTAAFDFVEGSHDGFEDAAHRRSVLFVKPFFWLVRDVMRGKGAHKVEEHWLFNEGQRLLVDAEAKNAVVEGGKAKLHIVFTTGEAQEDPGPPEVVKGARMTVTQEGELPLSFVTLFCPTKGTEVKPTMKVLGESPGAVGVAVEDGEVTTYTFFADNDEEHTFGEWKFKGDCAFVVMREEKPVQMGFVDVLKLAGSGVDFEFQAPTTMSWKKRADGVWEIEGVRPHFALVRNKGLVALESRLLRTPIGGGPKHKVAIGGYGYASALFPTDGVLFTVTAGKPYELQP